MRMDKFIWNLISSFCSARFQKQADIRLNFYSFTIPFHFKQEWVNFTYEKKRGSTKIGGMATLVIFVTSSMIVLIKKGNGIYTVTVTRADGVEAHEKW